MAHKVTVNVANVNLPNGFYYQAGQSVVLTDEEFARLASDVFTSSRLTDNGVVGVAGQQVTTQGSAVSNPAALTATTISTTGTGTELTDFTALATAINKLLVDITAVRTTVIALNTALSVSGGALA